MSAAMELSVSALFAAREEQRRREREEAEQLEKREREELAVFRKRLDEFEVTEQAQKAGIDRIRRAFERGDTELMLTSFPSGFCSDGGRAIINAGAPPINKPTPEEKAALEEEPLWVATLPAGLRRLFQYWKESLRPGGFGFAARIINYPNGMPGDVGIFITWPKSMAETRL